MYYLLGKPLSHSLSPAIHEIYGNKNYQALQIDESEFKDFILKKEYDGLNITMPYKQAVTPYLDRVDDSVALCGSVNTVINKNGKLIGYNTDLDGLLFALKSKGLNIRAKDVLILGSGGTAKTAVQLCKQEGARSFRVVSRTGEINYHNCYSFPCDILINTTPVGMYPNIDESPVDITKFRNIKGVMDVVYNPIKTRLLVDAITKLRVPVQNGLSMFCAQALYAHNLFFDIADIDVNLLRRATKKLYQQNASIALIGMAGSGKTTIAKLLSQLTGKPLIDTDNVVSAKLGMSVKNIILQKGESYFRSFEHECIKAATREGGRIIATGGGAALFPENSTMLRQNCFIVYIRRPLNQIATDGRPLYSSSSVQDLYVKRNPIYLASSHSVVDNDSTPEDCASKIIRLFEARSMV